MRKAFSLITCLNFVWATGPLQARSVYAGGYSADNSFLSLPNFERPSSVNKLPDTSWPIPLLEKPSTISERPSFNDRFPKPASNNKLEANKLGKKELKELEKSQTPISCVALKKDNDSEFQRVVSEFESARDSYKEQFQSKAEYLPGDTIAGSMKLEKSPLTKEIESADICNPNVSQTGPCFEILNQALTDPMQMMYGVEEDLLDLELSFKSYLKSLNTLESIDIEDSDFSNIFPKSDIDQIVDDASLSEADKEATLEGARLSKPTVEVRAPALDLPDLSREELTKRKALTDNLIGIIDVKLGFGKPITKELELLKKANPSAAHGIECLIKNSKLFKDDIDPVTKEYRPKAKSSGERIVGPISGLVLAEEGNDGIIPLAAAAPYLIPAAATITAAVIVGGVELYNGWKARELERELEEERKEFALVIEKMDHEHEEKMKDVELKAQKEKREFEAKEKEKDRKHELEKLALEKKSKESNEGKQPGGRKVVDKKVEKDGDPLEEERKKQEDNRKSSTTKTIVKDGGQFLPDYSELVEDNKNPIHVRVDPNYDNSIIENLKNDLSCLEAMQDLTKTRNTQNESIKKIQDFKSKVIRFDDKKDQIKKLEKLNAEKANTCSNRTYESGGF